MAQRTTEQHAVPFWRDERYLQLLGQLAVVLAVAALFYYLINNLIHGLAAQGIQLGFRFLRLTAGFDIGESLIEYSRSDTVLRALYVGFLNTLLVAFLGIIFATILGIVVGVARLSKNWLINKIAAVYVEFLRNIPLLVFLFFVYTVIFLKLPRTDNALSISFLKIYFSNRGIFIPWGIPGETFGSWLVILLVGLILAIVVGLILYRQGQRTGRMPLIGFWAPLTFVVVGLIGWIALPSAPLIKDVPVLQGRNFVGGRGFSPEFGAMLFSLAVYTSAFIAEIVRAGILAVSKGQREAATALGLSPFLTLRLVIFPQALRVIVPPLTSQYLNLTKNSSLAVAVGYPDVFAVANTILNQTGRAVEMIGITMIVYLTFSLLTSLFMNWYNARIRLVER
ncbi:MAG: ABC transporter permease subunit [Caldilineae bacterium]|nr:MAG: ABC transporter permease subunit [Caldilineae bacterium]